MSTNVNKTVVFQAEPGKRATEDTKQKPDVEKKKKKVQKKVENKTASEKTSASHTSTKVAPPSIANDELTSSVMPDTVTEQAPDSSTKNEITEDVKDEKVSTPQSVQTQKKPKPKPKVNLIKPSAGPSAFGKIKFDKNFAKKPQPNSKIVNSNGLTDERLKAFGINPRRYNWKLKHGNDNNLKPNPNKNKHPNANKKIASSNSQTAPPNKKRKLN